MKLTKSRKNGVCVAKMLAAVSLTVLATGTAYAQSEPEEAPVQDVASDEGEAIVVTGFRQSLEAALNLKRENVGAVDAIVAEDIAKFPDQNLAESLQRIPGISITRDGGEGRSITVRGLSSQFTRVRVNGMETIATSTDGASANRDRAFDFNVFASELFSSLVVNKTAAASLDEGSLGAVVDLNTGNPLAGKAGFKAALSVIGSYNDLSKDVGPRVAGLLSWRNDAGTLGASVSAAYSKTNTLELGNNTVRWAQARFDRVDATNCFTTQNSGGTYVPSAACDRAALSFHPRIPRYGEVAHDRERLGLTGSIQFAPSDATKISIDALYSKYDASREEQWGEVLLRSNERSINVVSPVYDANNNMISATLNDAWVRTEHYLRKSSTEFYQVGGTWDQDLSDNFRFTALGGISKSNADIPVETTIIFDDRDAQGYSYDYTNMARPRLTFGTSVTDPANFQLAEIRDRPSNVTNRFKTAQLRTEWDVTDGFTVKAGAVWRRFNFDTEAFTRDTAVCGNGGTSLVTSTSGTPACLARLPFMVSPLQLRYPSCSLLAGPASHPVIPTAGLCPIWKQRLHSQICIRGRWSTMRATSAACRKARRVPICNLMPRANCSALNMRSTPVSATPKPTSLPTAWSAVSQRLSNAAMTIGSPLPIWPCIQPKAPSSASQSQM
jgi:iron complex outermembrane recepter protein